MLSLSMKERVKVKGISPEVTKDAGNCDEVEFETTFSPSSVFRSFDVVISIIILAIKTSSSQVSVSFLNFRFLPSLLQDMKEGDHRHDLMRPLFHHYITFFPPSSSRHFFSYNPCINYREAKK